MTGSQIEAILKTLAAIQKSLEKIAKSLTDEETAKKDK